MEQVNFKASSNWVPPLILFIVTFVFTSADFWMQENQAIPTSNWSQVIARKLTNLTQDNCLQSCAQNTEFFCW